MKSLVIHVIGKLLTVERLTALFRFLARLVIRFRRPFIVGVTGSVGKTTTTRMIASTLRKCEAEGFVGHVGTTENNMNGVLGLSATLLLFGELKEEYIPIRISMICVALLIEDCSNSFQAQ